MCNYGHLVKRQDLRATEEQEQTSILSESRKLETTVLEMKKKSLRIFKKKEPFMDITVFQIEHAKPFVIVKI